MEPQARYDEICDDLVARDPDIVLGQMMGMPAIKHRSKMVGGFWKGSMIFKLPDEGQRNAALALEGAALFDPSERGRPMKEWVAVPSTHNDRWPELAAQAIASRT
jgi:hypothetical protein